MNPFHSNTEDASRKRDLYLTNDCCIDSCKPSPPLRLSLLSPETDSLVMPLVAAGVSEQLPQTKKKGHLLWLSKWSVSFYKTRTAGPVGLYIHLQYLCI